MACRLSSSAPGAPGLRRRSGEFKEISHSHAAREAGEGEYSPQSSGNKGCMHGSPLLLAVEALLLDSYLPVGMVVMIYDYLSSA